MNIIENYLNQTEYHIHCDMDGVLTDFSGQFESLGYGTEKDFKDNGPGFWSIINNTGVEYWRDMPWMKDGKELWNHIKKYNPIILSSPGKAKHAPQGKKEWVRKELGPKVLLILKQANQKRELANEKNILIDDMPENIRGWVEAGGIGILHKNTKETLRKLQDYNL